LPLFLRSRSLELFQSFKLSMQRKLYMKKISMYRVWAGILDGPSDGRKSGWQRRVDSESVSQM
jgi:hypothetical protein